MIVRFKELSDASLRHGKTESCTILLFVPSDIPGDFLPGKSRNRPIRQIVAFVRIDDIRKSERIVHRFIRQAIRHAEIDGQLPEQLAASFSDVPGIPAFRASG